ncbi:unnamed protein product [Fraxinus pennsylvanica]|uniref:BTB domain-containing protein n=1 Tax=Fraxinus pennsylvanica TaxID=56036 RepID=A0AAD1Z0F1_9LAMI|nr:unnamed protein product [Fraxinus pennsylvanica]
MANLLFRYCFYLFEFCGNRYIDFWFDYMTEREAKNIEIPNIRWDVFELMMRYIYTGSVDVTLDIAQDLLKAADQYLLEGLKRLCEYAIAQDISVENVSLMFELSEAFNVLSLRHSCILLILENFDKLSIMPW